jgi:apolipoprotein N-acyltransferase
MIPLLVLTALAGVSFALAAPPWSLFGLAWCSWMPLWWCVSGQGTGDREQRTENKRTILRSYFQVLSSHLPLTTYHLSLLGLAWGVAYYGVSLHWITGLHPLMWMGMSWGSSITIAGVAWLVLTLWNTTPIVLWMVGLSWGSARWQWTRCQQLAVGVAFWCSLDWLWSHLPIYSGSLAISQSPGNLWLLYGTRWFGSLGISAAIVLVNGLLAYGLRASLQRSPDSRTWWGLALGTVLMLHSFGWGMGQLARGAVETEEPLTLGLIQGNIPTRIKLTPAGIQQSLNVYTQGYQALARLGVDAVFMPEGALPLVWEGSTRTQSPLYQAIRRLGVPAWISTFLTAEPPHPGLSQSLIALDSTGTITSRYNKVKLVPFGEYIPLEKLLSKVLRRLSLMEGSLVPGQSGQSFNTPWGTAAIGICYEPLFPQILREQVKRGAAFILTASNLDPYDTRIMEYQEALNILRAIENDRWLVAVSNTGYSTVITPLGQVLWRSPPHQLTIEVVQLYPRQIQTFYSQTGEGVLLALLWGWALVLMYLGRGVG